MNTFYIPEANLPRLEKKLAAIAKKCNQNQVSFRCNQVGEEFKTYKDEETGTTSTVKYLIYEVEGKIQHNGWRFVATLDHHKDGNIIRAFDTEITVPDRYLTCGPTCEHCNKIRSRKDTYLIYNEETNEFKQVGKTCMTEYTNGLDAESVAFMEQFQHEMSTGFGSIGGTYKRYDNVKLCLNYAFECYRHWGYEKSHPTDEYGYETTPEHTTAIRVRDYMRVDGVAPSAWLTDKEREVLEGEMAEVRFDAKSDYAIKTTEDALKWISSQDVTDNMYLRNLKLTCADEYTETRNFGILVSLTAAYGRYLKNEEYKKEKEREAKRDMQSTHQGTVGEKTTLAVKSAELVTSFDNQFGTTWLYRFKDTDNNIYIWYASKYIDNVETVKFVDGKVKEHSEYNGIKQTVLTRCKVIY